MAEPETTAQRALRREIEQMTARLQEAVLSVGRANDMVPGLRLLLSKLPEVDPGWVQQGEFVAATCDTIELAARQLVWISATYKRWQEEQTAKAGAPLVTSGMVDRLQQENER